MKFEIYQGQDMHWYWRLRAANGEIIAQGEGYKTKYGATDCVDLIQRTIKADIIPMVKV